MTRRNAASDVFKMVIERSNGCWEFIGKTYKGYGRFKWGSENRAHRVACCAENDVASESIRGLHVMHSCDNPCCCNPDHLSIGTALENQLDSIRKNRKAIGERVTGSVLTSEQVIEIYMCTSMSQARLAKKFGVSVCTISKIKQGKNWKHVTSSLQRPRRQLVRGSNGRYISESSQETSAQAGAVSCGPQPLHRQESRHQNA